MDSDDASDITYELTRYEPPDDDLESEPTSSSEDTRAAKDKTV